jgi:4-carboxymuconolactone decarboxylase
MDDRQRHEAGLALRRTVLGDAYVERSLKRRNAFNTDFQDLITRYAWGEVWTRPGLDRRTRSLIVMAMLIALNRDEELRLHVRASHGNGVTRDELKELLLQAAIYCGVPAANGAFRSAEEVLAEMGAESR